MTPKVVVHGTRHCGYCHRAVQILERHGIPFQYVDVTGDRAARADLAARTGRTTVPQIWIGERWIGGCRELQELDDRGELVTMTAPNDRNTRKLG